MSKVIFKYTIEDNKKHADLIRSAAVLPYPLLGNPIVYEALNHDDGILERCVTIYTDQDVDLNEYGKWYAEYSRSGEIYDLESLIWNEVKENNMNNSINLVIGGASRDLARTVKESLDIFFKAQVGETSPMTLEYEGENLSGDKPYGSRLTYSLSFEKEIDRQVIYTYLFNLSEKHPTLHFHCSYGDGADGDFDDFCILNGKVF